MKSIALILFTSLMLISCSTSKKTASSSGQNNPGSATATSSQQSGKQDGLSFETAVFVKEKTERTGPASEYIWIKEHYTDYKVKQQSLVYNNKKPFDIITITFSDGKELDIYFDISNYFGKF